MIPYRAKVEICPAVANPKSYKFLEKSQSHNSPTLAESASSSAKHLLLASLPVHQRCVAGSSSRRSPYVSHVHAAAFHIGDRFKMESTEVLQAPLVGKLQVVDRVPKVIEKLEFGILSVFLAPWCCKPSD